MDYLPCLRLCFVNWDEVVRVIVSAVVLKWAKSAKSFVYATCGSWWKACLFWHDLLQVFLCSLSDSKDQRYDLSNVHTRSQQRKLIGWQCDTCHNSRIRKSQVDLNQTSFMLLLMQSCPHACTSLLSVKDLKQGTETPLLNSWLHGVWFLKLYII